MSTSNDQGVIRLTKVCAFIAIASNIGVVIVGDIVQSWIAHYYNQFFDPLPAVTFFVAKYYHPLFIAPIPIALTMRFLVLIKRKSPHRAFIQLCTCAYLLSLVLLLALLLEATSPFAMVKTR